MRSVIGPLFIVIGQLMVVGCALPDRSISRVDDLGFRQRGSLKRDASIDGSQNQVGIKSQENVGSPENAKAVASSQNGPIAPPTGDIAFKAPRIDRDIRQVQGKLPPETAPADKSGFNPGHSGVGVAGPDTGDSLAATSPADGSTTPVQLQGLEFDDNPPALNQQPGIAANPRSNARQSAGEQSTAKFPNRNNSTQTAEAPKGDSRIPRWSDRPVDLNAEGSAITRTASSASGGPNRGANLADLSKVPSLNHDTAQLPPLPWQSDLDQLIVRVEQNLAQSKPDTRADKQNEYLRKQAHLRLLYLMAQRQEEALTAIPGINGPQQEYWQQMTWALSNSLDTAQFPDSNDRAAQTVPPLSAALRQMREEASLSIKNMTFCRKISYFGNYERFPRNEFTPGYEVLLYTEIENFASTPTVDGEYRTSLKSQIEITDSQGKVVWTKGFPPTEDFCRNPRRDYFHNYQFHIPEDLPTGTYTLKLTIVDELSHKRNSNTLNFVLK